MCFTPEMPINIEHCRFAYMWSIHLLILLPRKQKAVVVEPAVFTCISFLTRAMGNEVQLKIKELTGAMFHVPLRFVL